MFVLSWEGEAYWAPPPPMVLHSYWLIERGIGCSSHGVATGPRNNHNGTHYIIKKKRKKNKKEGMDVGEGSIGHRKGIRENGKGEVRGRYI